MSQVRFNFLNWMPDQDVFGNDGLSVADNVIHDTEGYKQIKVATSGALSTLVGVNTTNSVVVRPMGPDVNGQGLRLVAAAHGTAIGGGATYVSEVGIYKLDEGYTAGSLEHVTITGLMSSINAMSIFAFSTAEIDDKVFYAVEGQYVAPGGSTTAAQRSGYLDFSFSSIGTGPIGRIFETTSTAGPSAYLCGRINNFVMVAQTGDRHTVQWSAIGDPTDWPTPATDDARSKQAGQETLNPAFGRITGISGDDFFGYVFQEKGISKFQYVGGNVVFAIDAFEEGRGCIQPNRFARVDDTIFFESERGYHKLTDGQIVDIGAGRVDDTYPPQYSNEQQQVVVNRAINTVFFQSQNIAYNYQTDQWTRQPALNGFGYYEIDSETETIGHLAAVGSAIGLSGEATSAAQSATITTGEKDIVEGGRTCVDAVRPLTNGGTVTCRVGVRDSLGDSVTWCTGTSVNTRTGNINFRNASSPAEGRYVRAEFTIADGFTTAMGADIEFDGSGEV